MINRSSLMPSTLRISVRLLLPYWSASKFSSKSFDDELKWYVPLVPGMSVMKRNFESGSNVAISLNRVTVSQP